MTLRERQCWRLGYEDAMVFAKKLAVLMAPQLADAFKPRARVEATEAEIERRLAVQQEERAT